MPNILIRRVAGLLSLVVVSAMLIGGPAGVLFAAEKKSAAAAPVAAGPMVVAVDASEAPAHMLHARITMPARPGAMTLVYPKWIPGEHGPTGPVVDVVGMMLTAGGKTLSWRRDPADMYLVNVEVPTGAGSVEAALDFVTPVGVEGFTSGASATSNLLILSWNQVLLYPAGPKADDLQVRAELKLPAGWQHGTALKEAGAGASVGAGAGAAGGAGGGAGTIAFKPVSLTTLIDSPVLAGAHFRTVALSPAGDARPAFLHIAADSEAALQPKPEVIEHYKNLVAEEVALFGARHYDEYHFLLTLSDFVAHFGLEHHQSSDNRIPERALLDDDARIVNAGLLSHEMVHSWNAKYRRPSGLMVPDYRQAIDSNMLWVYEGLTNYLGEILAARSGLRTPPQFRDALAMVAAELDNTPGRGWRPLVDTATAAQILFGAADAWESLRRSVDFYDEGTLIWLEADMTIRTLTSGKKSLDDFCHLFHGGADSSPMVRPYSDADVYAALNQVAAYDWKKFFDDRVQTVRPRAPLGGIEASGWRLIYAPEKNAYLKAHEAAHKNLDVRFSIGFLVGKGDVLSDVVGGSPAAKAGMAPGMKLIAVNGHRYNEDVLQDAIRLGKGGKDPLEIIAQNGEAVRVYRVDDAQGPRYPVLERDAAKSDVLSDIIKPHAAGAAAN